MIGDAWSVKVKRPTVLRPVHYPKRNRLLWRSGTAYNYGLGKPNYPVPAIPTWVEYLPSGNVAVCQPYYGRTSFYG